MVPVTESKTEYFFPFFTLEDPLDISPFFAPFTCFTIEIYKAKDKPVIVSYDMLYYHRQVHQKLFQKLRKNKLRAEKSIIFTLPKEHKKYRSFYNKELSASLMPCWKDLTVRIPQNSDDYPLLFCRYKGGIAGCQVVNFKSYLSKYRGKWQEKIKKVHEELLFSPHIIW